MPSTFSIIVLVIGLVLWLARRQQHEAGPAPDSHPTESPSVRRSRAYDQAGKASILLGTFFAFMWMVCTFYGPHWLTVLLMVLACAGLGGGLLLGAISGVMEGWNKPVP